jgi:hypothetical protein
LSTKRIITFDSRIRPVYSHLDPIVDLLLANGNRLAHEFKWGENRTGFFCHLRKDLDFDLIDKTFELPPFVRQHRENNSIECDKTWATIVGGMS